VLKPRRLNGTVLSTGSRWLSTSEKEALRKKTLDRFLRVNHAGEYGADRIYAGQLAVLGVPKDSTDVDKKRTSDLIQHMWDQEKEHLRIFNALLPATKSRPTALLPFWHAAGYLLGAGGALLGGARGAMAVTVAVESTITDHYNDQIRTLIEQDPEGHKELIETLTKIRDDEQEHHDTGLEEEAEKWALYSPTTTVVKAGCKAAIWMSERI